MYLSKENATQKGKYAQKSCAMELISKRFEPSFHHDQLNKKYLQFPFYLFIYFYVIFLTLTMTLDMEYLKNNHQNMTGRTRAHT